MPGTDASPLDLATVDTDELRQVLTTARRQHWPYVWFIDDGRECVLTSGKLTMALCDSPDKRDIRRMLVH
jgi:hypothetical protein